MEELRIAGEGLGRQHRPSPRQIILVKPEPPAQAPVQRRAAARAEQRRGEGEHHIGVGADQEAGVVEELLQRIDLVRRAVGIGPRLRGVSPEIGQGVGVRPAPVALHSGAELVQDTAVCAGRAQLGAVQERRRIARVTEAVDDRSAPALA